MMQFRLPNVVRLAAEKIVKFGNDIAWSTAVTFEPRMREKETIGLFCADLKDVCDEVTTPHGCRIVWQKPYIRIEIVRDLPLWFVTPAVRKNFGYVATTNIDFSLLDIKGQQQKTGSVNIVNACTQHQLMAKVVSGKHVFQMAQQMSYGLDYYMQNPIKRSIIKQNMGEAMRFALFEQEILIPALPDFILAAMGPVQKFEKQNQDPK